MKTLFLIWLESLACVALHEFSHVMIIILLRLSIKKIQIGYYKLLRVNKVTFGCFPLGGKVSFEINQTIKPIYICLLFGVGPLMTLLLLLISFRFEIFQRQIIQVILITQLILTIFGEDSDVKNIIMILRRNR